MFVGEALDHLGTIESVVLQLEGAPADVKLLNDVFRPFHTVKGNAGALGVTSVQELAHCVESLLDLARAGKHAMGPAEFDIVLRAVDLLTIMMQELPDRVATGTPSSVTARRDALMEAVDALIAGGSSATVARRGRARGRARAPTPARRARPRRAAAPAWGPPRQRGDEHDQGRHRQAGQPDRHGRRARHRAVDPGRGSGPGPLRRRAPRPPPGAAEAHHQRSAAQRDVDAHGADPPGVPEDGAAGARPQQAVRQADRAGAAGRGHRARSQGRRGHQRSADAHGPQQRRPRHRVAASGAPPPASRRRRRCA